MGDIAGWVDIGLEEHSYSWSALRPSLTQGINDTHVGTFGLTIFLETFDLTDTYHICCPQSGYFNVEIPFQGHQGHCRACGLGSYALRLAPKTGYDCDCSSVYATMVASQYFPQKMSERIVYKGENE